MQVQHDRDESRERIIDLDQRQRDPISIGEFVTTRRQRGGNQGDPRSAFFQLAKITVAFDEGNVVGASLGHGTSGENGKFLAVNASLNQFRQLRNGDLHVSAPLSSVKGTTPPREGPEARGAILTSPPLRDNANFPCHSWLVRAGRDQG